MRAFLRFLTVGGIGFLIDVGLTYVLIIVYVEPWLARIPSILLAACFTWLANRTFTYQVTAVRSADEALRYATVAIAMAILNYMVYLSLLWINIPPILSVTIATALQTIVSFHAYRRFAFKL